MNFSQNRELICSNEKFRIYVDGRGTVYTDYDNVSEFPYNRTYFQDGYLRFRPMWEEVFLEILDEAQQRGINPAMNWLDCGAGCGIFLNLLEQKGYTKIRGIEPSAEACEMSEAVTNADIINEEPLLIPEELLDPQDVISLIDVLAHVPEPEEMLRWCYRHLKENALCIIKTPHRAPDYVRFCLKHFPKKTDFIANLLHIGYQKYSWGFSGIENLLLACGFDKVECIPFHEFKEQDYCFEISELWHPRRFLYRNILRKSRKIQGCSSILVFALKTDKNKKENIP